MTLYSSDLIRKQLVETAIKNNGYLAERVQIVMSEGNGVYTEIITEDEFEQDFSTIEEYKGLTPLQIAERLVNERIGVLLEDMGYEVDEALDFDSTDFYDGYQITVPFKKLNEGFDENAFFEELDGLTDRKPVIREKSTMKGQEKPAHPGSRSSLGSKPRPIKNKAGDVPLNQEPDHEDTAHLPTKAKKAKTQNPRKVDLLLKSVFEGKFKEYRLATDIGAWKPAKTLNQNGKLQITWENVDENKVIIETLIFPDDSNKIKILVKERSGKVLIDYFFEVYRIPTDAALVERFFRKTFFNLLKKFIDTRVIQLEPFNLSFIFWKTDNPYFSYSFSSPKKNKIVNDLIAFISTAKKPILDDFFEQNNLKHKQGYLQTLLDSAEAAGIFKFAREGNEIIILKGPNYKSFLEGKIRRVS